MQLTKKQIRESWYQPGVLLDFAIHALGARNDAGLANALKVDQPTISRMRGRTLSVGPTTLIRLHILTNATFADMWKMLGLNPENGEPLEAS